MAIDLRKGSACVRSTLERFVARYAGANRGRSSKPFHPPVTRIDILYSLGDGTSTPFFALNVDTKTGGEPDGSPTHAEYDFVELTEWGWVIRDPLELETFRWPIILGDGERLFLGSDEFEERIGEMFVEELKRARDEGVFSELPKGERCELGVESEGGEFGWPRYEDRGKENLA